MYDMVQQSWIINCLKMFKISDEVINVIKKTMKTWRVELTVGWRSLAEAKIHRGVFQGDAPSPLLFITAIMPLKHILRKCTAGCGNRDETINHIISECSKKAEKEYKTRHNWVCKLTHWEICKKLKFDHTNKWYIHNPASLLENDTHKLLWDFNIQTGYLILARRSYLIIIDKKKRICKIADFAVPADHWIKLKECEKKDKMQIIHNFRDNSFRWFKVTYICKVQPCWHRQNRKICICLLVKILWKIYYRINILSWMQGPDLISNIQIFSIINALKLYKMDTKSQI